MIKKIAVFLGIIQSLLCYASEAEIPPFKKITHWSQMEHFAAKLIAYQTTSRYFQNDITFPTDEKTNLYYYGFVAKEASKWGSRCTYTGYENGYGVIRLIKKGGVHSVCAFVDEKIKEDDLFVHEATKKERQELCDLLTKGIVEFAYTSTKKAMCDLLKCHELGE